MSAETRRLTVASVRGDRIDLSSYCDAVPTSVLGIVKVEATDGSWTVAFNATGAVPTVGDDYLVTIEAVARGGAA